MNEFTLGIEEEYMVIDPVTRELTSHEQKIVEAAQKIHKDQVKAEMHQAVVEVGTGICRTTTEARKEIAQLRYTVSQLAGEQGLRIGAAGTHPFSHWEKQLITEEQLEKHKAIQIPAQNSNSIGIKFFNISFQYEGPKSPFILKNLNFINL